MPSNSRAAILIGALCVGTFSGCANDEFSSTHDYSKKEVAPIPVADPSVKLAPPAAPANQGPTDKDAPQEFTTTDSGLKYRILRKSTGRKPTANDSVVAHYRGWVDNTDKHFDSSYDRGEPTPFSLRGVIKGWTEGLQYIGEGGMIELEIPGKLGYPEGRPGSIPPGATLRFVVELVKIQ